MQRSGENPPSLGICQRLFKLIMNGLFAKGLRRVTSGHPAPPDNSDLTSTEENRILEPSGSRIRVRFKETEDSEYWDFWKVEKEDVDGGEGTKPVMDYGVESSEKKKSRRKVSIEMQEPRRKGQSYKHLFSVESNINEKTEAFIRHRKEEMTKTS